MSWIEFALAVCVFGEGVWLAVVAFRLFNLRCEMRDIDKTARMIEASIASMVEQNGRLVDMARKMAEPAA